MAGEIVGTAFVRIKAITSGIAKDIERDVKKAMKDADLEKIGRDGGDELGGGIADGAEKTLKKRAKNIVPKNEITEAFDDVRDGVEKSFGQLDFGDLDFFGNIREEFRQMSFDFDEDSLRSASERIRDRIGTDFSDGLGDLFKDFDVDFDFLNLAKRNIQETRDVFEDSLEDIRRDARRTDDDVGKSFARLGAKLKNFGSDGLPHIGLLTKGIGLIGAAVTASLPFIQDLGAGILAYLTGLVAQVGFLSTALLGGVTALGAAAGSVLLAIAPIALAFAAPSAALEDFKDSMKAAGEEFLRIGTATQQTLLPGLDDAVFILGDLVPMFSEFGLFVGRSAGNFARLAAATLAGNEAQNRFREILQSSLRILDIFFPMLINVGDVLSGIWVAAIPASERFVAALSNMVQRWRDLVVEGLASGTLTETLNTWYDRAQLVGSALGNLTGALFDILQIGADESDNVFARFDEWAERYRAFTSSEEGRNRIGLIFENALAVMREVNAVAVELFDGVFGRLGEIGGVDGLVSALQTLREALPGLQEDFQDILETIDGVARVVGANIWEKFQQAVEELRDPLGRLGTQLLELMEAIEESGAFELFLDLMRILTNTLSTLLAIPGFGTFIGYVIAFGTATKVARIALGPFTSVLGSFITQMVALRAAAAGQTIAGVSTALSRFVLGFRGAAPAIQAAGQAVAGAATTAGAAAATAATQTGGLAAAFGSSAAGLGAIALPLAAVGGALAIGGYAFYKHQQRVQEWRQELRQAEEALGTLNGGLLITADGIAKYIAESSRFDSRNQLDDLNRIGIGYRDLAVGIEQGTIGLKEFVDTAIASGEIDIQINSETSEEIGSLRELANQYDLTGEEIAKLRNNQDIYVNGTRLSLGANDDLIGSFVELRGVIAASARENLDAFVLNDQNIRLLGESYLANLRSSVNDEDTTDDEAIQLMRTAFTDLGAAAAAASDEIIGVSDETRRQIREQVAGAGSLAEQQIAENQLLAREQARVFAEIANDFELFSSDEFAAEFGDARQAVLDFSELVNNTDFSAFDDIESTFGIDGLTRVFPEVASATQNLFDQLRNLPEDEFNAAARAMGADAETLRGAVDGAYQAISDLQEAAISTLPSVGELLDEAMSVTEDGDQFFNPEEFLSGARERIDQTNRFAENIAAIQAQFGEETARLAAQQGPEAAQAFRDMAGSDPNSVNQVIADMEAAEDALRTQISTVLGPGIALEYAATADLIGTDMTIGLSNGLSDPAALAALRTGAEGLLNEFLNTFRGNLTILPDGQIRFVRTGRNSNPGNRPTSGAFSEGGYVGNTPLFGGGPGGTDTVNAWLTPGEFVLRKAVAQAIPRDVLISLNSGDPRMVGLLSSLNRNRPASVESAVASVVAVQPGRTANPGFVIEHMSIESPSPLETSRQVADRLRIMQSQLSSR